MGECSRCGKCCEGIAIRDKLSPEMHEYLQTRGYEHVKGFYLIPSPCQHLRYIDNILEPGKVIAQCAIYPERPKICRMPQGRKAFGTEAYVPEGCTLVEK